MRDKSHTIFEAQIHYHKRLQKIEYYKIYFNHILTYNQQKSEILIFTNSSKYFLKNEKSEIK